MSLLDALIVASSTTNASDATAHLQNIRNEAEKLLAIVTVWSKVSYNGRMDDFLRSEHNPPKQSPGNMPKHVTFVKTNRFLFWG